MNFIKRVLSTVTGIFVFLFICFGLLIILGALFGGASDETVSVKNNSVLELKLDFEINDYEGRFDYGEYAFLDSGREYNDLFDIIDAIHYAANDDKIKGITIENNTINAGISQTKAIRDALLKFKESGKFITSYADVYNQKDYYLNSIADTIFINPAGYLDFKGLSTELLYFKDFQEETGLKMEVVRLGKYKSAVEPFLSNNMSDENREQIRVFLNSIWGDMKSEISKSRNITPERLNTIAYSLLARTPILAKKSGLVDKIAYHDQYHEALKTALNTRKKINSVTIKEYAKYASKKSYLNKTKNKIAVIYTQGTILYGEGDENTVGQISINKSLIAAREDDQIKAIVLRVNSPGGSALASELIWREIELTKKVKPVIVSMGDLAASGGYYIACNADKIIAEPTTITGSIGVFGTLPNGKQLADRWGINAEQVKTNDNAISYSFFEPLDNTQRAMIKEGISDIYELFTKRVADGRNMSQDAVKQIAQGRVWTGNDAVKNGLVDELGGLDVALKHAASAAEIDAYKIKEFPVFDKDFEKIFSDLGVIKSKEDILKEELGADNYKILKHIKRLTQLKGAQLLLPYEVTVK